MLGIGIVAIYRGVMVLVDVGLIRWGVFKSGRVLVWVVVVIEIVVVCGCCGGGSAFRVVFEFAYDVCVSSRCWWRGKFVFVDDVFFERFKERIVEVLFDVSLSVGGYLMSG